MTAEEISKAANDLKAVAEECVAVGVANHRDLVCYLNNAAILLRLAGRQADCENLLRRGIQMAPEEPQLKRMLALAQASQGHNADAIETLAGDEDAENRLLAAELTSQNDPTAALEMVNSLRESVADPHFAQLRFRILGHLALIVGDQLRFAEAVSGLRELNEHDVTAGLLELRWDHKGGDE